MRTHFGPLGMIVALATLGCLLFARAIPAQAAASKKHHHHHHHLHKNKKTHPKKKHPGKKGIGFGHGMKEKALEELHVSWYYNWGPEPKVKSPHVEFVPMIWSAKELSAKTSGAYVLGYNEPDLKTQADMSVKDALHTWPTLAEKAKNVGSPAMSGGDNPATSKWFRDFMKAKPRVDFVAVHWYGGADAKHFIKFIEAVHAAYDKPIWVTEFAPQTRASSSKDPHEFTQAEVDHFITETIKWMDKTSYVQRYAWHNPAPGSGTSALVDEQGNLTATGKAYAAAH